MCCWPASLSPLLSCAPPAPSYRATAWLVRRGPPPLDSADVQALRTSVLEDVRSRQEQTLVSYEGRLLQMQQQLARADSAATPGLPPAATLLREVQAKHPSVRQLSLSRLVRATSDSLRADTTVIVALSVRQALPAAEQQRLAAWLRVRTGAQRQVQLLVSPETPARPANK
jgi:hypothetical protein